jgi:3-hydroxyisobutyrate dehydrogenase
MRVGVVGLGIMGAPMARNLLRAGHSVTVHNRTPARMAPLLDAGASGAASPREVAARVDAVVTCLSDTPDVEAVIAGPNGILEGAARGLLVVDCSTIAPAGRAGARGSAAGQGVDL